MTIYIFLFLFFLFFFCIQLIRKCDSVITWHASSPSRSRPSVCGGVRSNASSWRDPLDPGWPRVWEGGPSLHQLCGTEDPWSARASVGVIYSAIVWGVLGFSCCAASGDINYPLFFSFYFYIFFLFFNSFLFFFLSLSLSFNVQYLFKK